MSKNLTMGNGLSESTLKVIYTSQLRAYRNDLREYSHYNTINRYESFTHNMDCFIYTPSKKELSEIAKMVNICQVLSYLDLSRLNLSDEQLIFFIRSLIPEKVQIKRLILSDNDLTDASMDALCNFITRNSTITNLDLARNYISDSGFDLLGKLLAVKDIKLNSLILDNNLNTKRGNHQLLLGLKENRSVTYVSFSSADESDIQYAETFISRNKNLKDASYMHYIRSLF